MLSNNNILISIHNCVLKILEMCLLKTFIIFGLSKNCVECDYYLELIFFKNHREAIIKKFIKQ